MSSLKNYAKIIHFDWQWSSWRFPNFSLQVAYPLWQLDSSQVEYNSYNPCPGMFHPWACLWNPSPDSHGLLYFFFSHALALNSTYLLRSLRRHRQAPTPLHTQPYRKPTIWLRQHSCPKPWTRHPFIDASHQPTTNHPLPIPTVPQTTHPQPLGLNNAIKIGDGDCFPTGCLTKNSSSMVIAGYNVLSILVPLVFVNIPM